MLRGVACYRHRIRPRPMQQRYRRVQRARAHSPVRARHPGKLSLRFISTVQCSTNILIRYVVAIVQCAVASLALAHMLPAYNTTSFYCMRDLIFMCNRSLLGCCATFTPLLSASSTLTFVRIIRSSLSTFCNRSSRTNSLSPNARVQRRQQNGNSFGRAQRRSRTK